MYQPTPPRIAVINSNEDLLEVITAALTEEGYIAIPAPVRAFRQCQESFIQFMAEHAPQAILWDIAPPYEANWEYFQAVKKLPALQGRPCILTTTNAKRLREITGKAADIIEIVGKPYDLDQIIDAIKKALTVC